MKIIPSWTERYASGELPWDSGRHDFNLSSVVAKRPIKPCKVLEVGCGTGSNALWLSKKGFMVTAIDIVDIAIKRAINKSSKTHHACKFYVADFMKQKIKERSFMFVFDRGCFHSFDSLQERNKYAKIVHSYLKRGGLWLTLVGSADAPTRTFGPPRRSAKDIIIAVEPYFQVLSLYQSYFDSNMKNPPKAWVCLMQKRNKKKKI